MSDLTTQDPRPVDLLDGEFYAADPYPTYAWLRDNEPVYWDPVNELWAVFRYEDVLACERDTRRYSSDDGTRPNFDYPESMINMDDPEHSAQRRMINRRFTPKAIAAHETAVRECVTMLLDRVSEKGYCDAVHDLAAPLPALMIGDKLGFSRDDWEFLVWVSETTMLAGGGPRYANRASDHAIEQLGRKLHFLIRDRREQPRDDLISVWANEPRADGKIMSDEDIFHEVLLVIDGGAETTRTTIGKTILDLIEHPDQQRLLRDDPGLLSTTAVEEMIRWVTPLISMRRTVREDHELRDRRLQAGDQLLLMYQSANRDPRAFADPGPDTYDLTRADNRQISFGFGTHFCLGAWLARLEIRVFFEEFLRRCPEFELEAFASPRIRPHAFARGLEHLRIEFTPHPPEGSIRFPGP